MTAILSLISSFVSFSVASHHILPLSANLSRRELVRFWLRGIIVFRWANTVQEFLAYNISVFTGLPLKIKRFSVSVQISLIKTSYSFLIQNATPYFKYKQF